MKYVSIGKKECEKNLEYSGVKGKRYICTLYEKLSNRKQKLFTIECGINLQRDNSISDTSRRRVRDEFERSK